LKQEPYPFCDHPIPLRNNDYSQAEACFLTSSTRHREGLRQQPGELIFNTDEEYRFSRQRAATAMELSLSRPSEKQRRLCLPKGVGFAYQKA